MKLQPFALERYFAQYEFNAKYMLSSSDIESLTLSEVLEMADDETRELWDNLRLSYTESQGLPLLRKEIASLYDNVNESDVLVVVPEEGIFLAMQAALNPGDHVIVTFPGYQSLYEIAKSIGCEITFWEPDEQNNWKFDPQFLEDNIRPNTKLIACNFPHNPTGYLPTTKDWERIVNIARKNNTYIFSDEMYWMLELDNATRLPSAADVYEKAISLFGMSKTFGMPGIRLGWVVTRDKTLYKKMADMKDYTTICSPAPSEILSLIALRARNKIVENHKKLLHDNLVILRKFLEKYKNLFSFNSPSAGSICFVKLEMDESALELCDKLVKETGIMLLPSTVYSYGDKHVRIGFARRNFKKVLEKLEVYLDKQVQIPTRSN